jgi:translation initiation factor 6
LEELVATPLRAMDLGGDPFIGVFAEATEEHVFVPIGAPAAQVAALEAALGVKRIIVSVGGTRVIGTLLCANRAGVVIGDIALDEEVAPFKAAGLHVHRLAGRLNAAGNIILANDKAALVHPRLGQAQVQAIADTLDVEVEKGTVAGLYTVGSAALATSKGVLAHPKIDDEEMDILKDLFGVDVGIGTINYGSPMIGSGVLANSRGAVFGTPSTGVERGRVADALNLI